MTRNTSVLMAALAGALLLGVATAAVAADDQAPAQAPESAPALTYSLVYTADVTGVPGNDVHAGRYLDNLDAIADLDLEKAVGWRGGALHAYVLNNSGGAPNDIAGTLQGVDNIEVATPRLRMFELWLEQSFADGKASARGGLYNLNSEFYSNDTAAIFLAPAFGIGSELAATGPNGPSIFPSTALGLRLNVDLGGGAYARAAVLNAKAGVMGDPQGVDFSFDDGVLSIVQVGLDRPLKVSLGLWSYSKTQPDIREVDANGAPVQQRAQGAYLQGEHRLFGADEGRTATAFVRLGVSDGDTTPFRGGWQAGLRVDKLFASRPDSTFAIGLEQGVLDPKFQANLRDQGTAPSSAESGIEVTYSDRLNSRITVQPDLQWIRHAGGDSAAPDRFVAALRVRIELFKGSAK